MEPGHWFLNFWPMWSHPALLSTYMLQSCCLLFSWWLQAPHVLHILSDTAVFVLTLVTLQCEEMNVRSSLWGRNQEPSASKRLLPFCPGDWSVNRFVLDIYLPLLGLNGMSRLSSKEAFSLRCVLPALVEMIKQDTRLSLWICSPLHYVVLHFYVTSSSLYHGEIFQRG